MKTTDTCTTKLLPKLRILLALLVLFFSSECRAIERELTRLTIPSRRYTIDALAVSEKGRTVTCAVIFIGGSGSWEIVDSYLKNPIESYGNMPRFYIEENFLQKGLMIVYLNKRGIGKSTGKWRKSGFDERADDVSAAIKFVASTYHLEEQRIGLLGHSQGCWIAQLAAVKNPNINFIINLGGPFMDPYQQTLLNDLEVYKCQKLSDKEIRKKQYWRKKELGLGKAVGPVIGGEAGHWAKIARYDRARNAATLQQLKVPSLFVFAQHDANVPPIPNYEYAKDLFKGPLPSIIQVYEQAGIDHYMHEATSPCDPYPWTLKPVPPHSAALRDKLTTWIDERFFGEDRIPGANSDR
jgi:pimeloyl-ACP methyl ester carboxylesterase